jgi:hypothetical protein
MTTTKAAVPIAEVTVLEDRAHVVRRARVSLEAGQVRLGIEGVAPVLSDKTLLAQIEGEGARVVDARVRRRKVVRSDEQSTPAGSLEELRRELERLEDRLSAIEGERRASEERNAALEVLAKLTLGELAEDVAWSKPAHAGFVEEMKSIAEQRRALGRERIELAHRSERQKRTIARLAERIRALDTPAEHAAADLEIHRRGSRGQVPAVGGLRGAQRVLAAVPPRAARRGRRALALLRERSVRVAEHGRAMG